MYDFGRIGIAVLMKRLFEILLHVLADNIEIYRDYI